MKLRISRRKRRIALALYWGGILSAILFGFTFADGVSWGLAAVLLCFAIGMAGALWCHSLYVCPQCGRRLIGRGLDNLFMTPYPHCPNCGWKTEIEWTE